MEGGGGEHFAFGSIDLDFCGERAVVASVLVVGQIYPSLEVVRVGVSGKDLEGTSTHFIFQYYLPFLVLVEAQASALASAKVIAEKADIISFKIYRAAVSELIVHEAREGRAELLRLGHRYGLDVSVRAKLDSYNHYPSYEEHDDDSSEQFRQCHTFSIY